MPLSGAARRNHIHVAELLISKGAAVNVNEDTGHTPLMTAVQHGHDLMVELLITKGANVNCKDPLTGWTPLMLAALNGHTTAAQILIKNGANCNEVNILDKTAFEIAKKRKRKDVENVLERVTTLGIRDAGNVLSLYIEFVFMLRIVCDYNKHWKLKHPSSLVNEFRGSTACRYGCMKTSYSAQYNMAKQNLGVISGDWRSDLIQ